MTIIAIALGAILLLGLIYVYATRDGRTAEDTLSDEQVSGTVKETADPAKACATQRTYDELRRELFRKAAAIRGRDEAVFDQIARNAMLSIDRPRLVEHDASLGQARCSGTLVVALPPGLATGSGGSRIRGEAEYAVQAAADGSGTTVTLLTGDSMTAALATLVRSGTPSTQAPAPQPDASADPLLPTPPAPERPAATEPVAAPPANIATAARPSFNCALARTRGERAVCASDVLAGLDRQMAAQYGAAARSASPDQARLLRTTRDRFLAFRDRCGNDRCIADAYRGRMREIDDIMSGNWRR